MEQINASRKLETRLQIPGLDRRLSEDMEVAVYRICQEVVQNVMKHSGATSLSIRLIDHQDSFNIIVEDNGVGIRDKDFTKGFGFRAIQSKVNLFKGSF